MNKSLLIMVLALLHSGCASTTAGTEPGRNMLTYEQIASEISIRHEKLTSDPDLSRTTAQNTPNSI